MRRAGPVALLALLALVLARAAAPSAAYDCCLWRLAHVKADGSGRHELMANSHSWEIGDLSPDRKRMVILGAHGDLYSAQVNGTGVRRLARNDVQLRNSRYSPDGRNVVFTRDRQGQAPCGHASVWTVRSDGSDERQVTGPCASFEAYWAPDSRRLAFIDWTGPSDQCGRIAVANRDGSGERKLTRCVQVQVPGQMAWSPRGDRIAYVVGYNPARLHVVRSDGSRDLIIARGDFPRWSPDGRRLAFDYGADGVLAVINADGTHFHVLDRRATAYTAAWGPDGSLAYGSGAGVWIARSDGTHRRRVAPVVPTAIAAKRLFWSPGGLLAFASGRDVWVVRADGSHLKRIVRQPEVSGSELRFGRMWWTPDSRSLIYEWAAECCD